MTNQEIDALKPGRELDRLIAEKVLGWRNLEWQEGKSSANSWSPTGYFGEGPDGEVYLVGQYGQDIRKAWMVVERMNALGYWCQMQTPVHGGADGYWCGFAPVGLTGWPIKPLLRAQSERMSLAICRAALKAVNADPEPFFERAGAVKGLAGCEEMEEMAELEVANVD